MTLEHLGNIQCVDCGDSHDIYKNEAGLLTSIDKCHGKVPKGASREQKIEITDSLRHVESVIDVLKKRFDEGDWEQIRALADEAIVKLNTINLTAGEVEKS